MIRPLTKLSAIFLKPIPTPRETAPRITEKVAQFKPSKETVREQADNDPLDQNREQEQNQPDDQGKRRKRHHTQLDRAIPE